MHQGLTAPILEERVQETCPQLQVKANRTEPPQHRLSTRAQNIKELLRAQADTEPGQGATPL